MTTYIALLRKAADREYGINFPDFPGCVTAGSTLEEARVIAAEALASHIEGMVEDGTEIPQPSTLDGVINDDGNAGAVAVLVEVPVDTSRAVRLNITISEDLLKEIDQATDDRSRFLANAARQALRRAS
jgi:predicted RNase H-like HicB family nuclease